MQDLAKVCRAFQDRFHLSRAKAAKVLGVSDLYLRSIYEGADVRTGLPFRPREATLRQLAAKMTEFGYPMTFEQLQAAASQDGYDRGKTAAIAELREGREVTKRKLHEASGVATPEPAGGAPQTLLEFVSSLGHLEHTMTEDERTILAYADKWGETSQAIKTAEFWCLPPLKRLPLLLGLQRMVDEVRHVQEGIGKVREMPARRSQEERHGKMPAKYRNVPIVGDVPAGNPREDEEWMDQDK